MGLRVTPSMLYRTGLADLARQRRALADTQEKAASGLEINRPSDDPNGASAAMLLRSGTSAVEQYLRNNATARARVEAAETAVGNVTNLLIRARELATQGANSAIDLEGRTQIAREIEALHAALLSESNSQHAGGTLFGGHTTDSEAFSVTGDFTDAPVAAPTVSFAGDSNSVMITIDQGESVEVTFDGRRVFMGDLDGDGNPDGDRENLFELLGDLRNALVENDDAGIRASLDRSDDAISQLSEERTRIGSTAQRLATADDRLESRKVNLETRLSDLQDADFAEVVSDLVQQEAALQAGLAATARLLQPTLLDFLT